MELLRGSGGSYYLQSLFRKPVILSPLKLLADMFPVDSAQTE